MSASILYLSQMAPPDLLRAYELHDEAATIPPVFDELGATVHVADVITERPPDPDGYDGVVVGGSVGSATDADEWRLRLGEWLQAEREVPVLAICGGHQALAVALGGTIERLPSRQVGVYPLQLPGIEGFTGEVVQSHGEGVALLPEDARVWARDELCVQALRYESPVARWSVQFHPEATPDSARRMFASFKRDPEQWPDDALAGAIEAGRALLRAWLGEL